MAQQEINELIDSLSRYNQELTEFKMGAPRLFTALSYHFGDPQVYQLLQRNVEQYMEVLGLPEARKFADLAPNLITACITALGGEDCWYGDEAVGPRKPYTLLKYRTESVGDEGREVFQTDDEGSFIRHTLIQYLQDMDVVAHIKVAPAADGFYRVEVTFLQSEEGDKLFNVSADISGLFQGRGWYACQASGQSEDGMRQWYVVKHKGGPWI